MQVKTLTYNLLQTNCHVIWDKEGNAAVIDPCNMDGEGGGVSEFLRSNGLSPRVILLTHAHFDHIYGVSSLASEYGIPVLMHPDDETILKKSSLFCSACGIEPAPDSSFSFEAVSDAQVIKVGSFELEVLHTPGHSPGSVSYLCREQKALFSGDTLFRGTIGRSDLPYGDYDVLMKSIFEKLMVLDGDIEVFPGHGGATSIAEERTTNPFLEPFNEPFEE